MFSRKNTLENNECQIMNAGPGDIVVMDNLLAYHVAAVADAIAAYGACAWYLPPHSLDFKSIELLWTSIKRELRQLKLRQVEPRCT